MGSEPPTNYPPGLPPQYQPASYPPSPYGPPPYAQEPFQAPEPAPQNNNNRGGLTGWLGSAGIAAFGVLKYGALLLLKLKTVVTLLISFAAYSWWRGPEFGAALVVMILVHELGHVFEIRRQGMEATAPLFIPFVGAAIFQKSHPTDALKQAQIGIAGPIAGTLGATVCWVLFGATGLEFFKLAAIIGFAINLFNMIPVGMLDGGWILAPASKWFQVLGIAILAGLVLFFHVGYTILLILAVFGLPVIVERFRNDRSSYYQSVPVRARWAMGGAWLALVLYLAVSLVQISGLLSWLNG